MEMAAKHGRRKAALRHSKYIPVTIPKGTAESKNKCCGRIWRH